MRTLLLICSAFAFISCSNDSNLTDITQVDDCIQEFKISLSITSEEAYPDDCLTTFEMYECDGGVYFLGCDHCAICESIPLYCDGEYLSNTITPNENYIAYIKSSKFVKVIGYIE